MCFKVSEGGREGASNTGLKGGGQNLQARERLNDASEQSRRSWVTGAPCPGVGERSGRSFFPSRGAAGLGRARARRASGDGSRSMGHSASSETATQQPAQHNTGESRSSAPKQKQQSFPPRPRPNSGLICFLFFGSCEAASVRVVYVRSGQVFSKQGNWRAAGTGRWRRMCADGMW